MQQSLMMRVFSVVCLWVVVGCESDPTAVAKGRQTAIVHAVLNPVVHDQFILLENTLSGRIDPRPVVERDPREPILDGGGDPILDAHVVVFNELGDSAIALERRTDPGSPYHQGGGGKGAGVYAFFNSIPKPPPPPAPPAPPHFMRVVRGARYRLEVRAADGRMLRAATTVPDANASTTVRSQTFNRDRDTVSLTLPEARFAKRYGIHIQTPYGPFELFTDQLQYKLFGSLRNVDATGRPRAFVPGFEQIVSLSAVDTNYFDYFRSSNDSVSGRGLLEHVDGGSGVFGSYAPLDRTILRVVADMDEPVEARYVEDGTGRSLTLYINEKGAGLTQLSGNYGTATSNTGVLGQLRGGELSLVFLTGYTLSDTLYTMTGTWTGDVITGTRTTGGDVTFRRMTTP